MNYFVYIIKSLKNNDLYIGSTSNLDNRLKLHNRGRVKSTKGYRPWQLLKYYKFQSRSQAIKKEMFLNTGQ